MDEIRGDVVQHALVVRDEQDAQVRTGQSIDALGDNFEGVDIQAGVGLVHQSNFGLQQSHLQNLSAFLFAAGEAIVDRAVDKAIVDFEQAHLFLQQCAELSRGECSCVCPFCR